MTLPQRSTAPRRPPSWPPSPQPYDTSAIPAIEKAIMQSDLGLTPNNDGRVIRLQVPQLTAVSAAAWAGRPGALYCH